MLDLLVENKHADLAQLVPLGVALQTIQAKPTGSRSHFDLGTMLSIHMQFFHVAQQLKAENSRSEVSTFPTSSRFFAISQLTD